MSGPDDRAAIKAAMAAHRDRTTAPGLEHVAMEAAAHAAQRRQRWWWVGIVALVAAWVAGACWLGGRTW